LSPNIVSTPHGIMSESIDWFQAFTTLRPVLDAYERHDGPVSGRDVVATITYFCKTGLVRLEWHDHDDKEAS